MRHPVHGGGIQFEVPPSWQVYVDVVASWVLNFAWNGAIIGRERLRVEPENGLGGWCDLLRELA